MLHLAFPNLDPSLYVLEALQGNHTTPAALIQAESESQSWLLLTETVNTSFKKKSYLLPKALSNLIST